MIRMH